MNLSRCLARVAKIFEDLRGNRHVNGCIHKWKSFRVSHYAHCIRGDQIDSNVSINASKERTIWLISTPDVERLEMWLLALPSPAFEYLAARAER